MKLIENQDVFDKIAYAAANPVAAQLVARAAWLDIVEIAALVLEPALLAPRERR